jgi:hypothetical protein
VAVAVSGIEGDLDGVSGLTDAQFKDGLTIEEVLVSVLARPTEVRRLGAECIGSENDPDEKRSTGPIHVFRIQLTERR